MNESGVNCLLFQKIFINLRFDVYISSDSFMYFDNINRTWHDLTLSYIKFDSKKEFGPWTGGVYIPTQKFFVNVIIVLYLTTEKEGKLNSVQMDLILFTNLF